MLNLPNPTRVRAIHLAEHLDLRQLERTQVLSTQPLTLRIREDSCAVVFRYGTTVLFNTTPHDESAWLRELQLHAREPVVEPIVEEAQLMVSDDGSEGIEDDILKVPEITLQRLQLVAHMMAKSVVLERYEKRATGAFERIEPLSRSLMQFGSHGIKIQELLKHIGEVLLHQQSMVGRVEVTEKPDLLWDYPELERFYLRLEDEFEIQERDKALERKLELISRTAQTIMDVVNTKRSLWVEWYITILILVEIVLSLYDMFFRAH